jgi:exosortase/archaeosortase family protein
MTSPLLRLLLLAAAYWSAWIELAERLRSIEAVASLALVVLAVATPAALRLARGGRLLAVPLAPAGLLLALYACACAAAPPIAQMAVAVAALLHALHRAGHDGRPPPALLGLALLALPALPTLEFYLAFPLRLASAGLTAGLLQAGGLAVSVDGVALRWGERLIQFDAPCSGVHMLWAALFLASAIAFLDRFGTARYLAAVAVALVLAVAGNALRAASLFYVESGIVTTGMPAAAHDAIGLAAFAMTATAFVAVVRRRPWRAA